jgi:hypothetical protein
MKYNASDASDERRLHIGDGWQSSDGNCKQLTTSDVLQDHVRTKTFVKPYECGKRFTSISSM